MSPFAPSTASLREVAKRNRGCKKRLSIVFHEVTEPAGETGGFCEAKDEGSPRVAAFRKWFLQQNADEPVCALVDDLPKRLAEPLARLVGHVL